MKTTRTWAIAGVSAALILVPAGASYAGTTASGNTPLTAIERVQLRVDRLADCANGGGGAYGAAYGDQTRSQVRDPAQDPSGDYTRDQVRDQLRDTENCDGDGPIGDGPQAGDNAGRGMMGGRS